MKVYGINPTTREFSSSLTVEPVKFKDGVADVEDDIAREMVRRHPNRFTLDPKMVSPKPNSRETSTSTSSASTQSAPADSAPTAPEESNS